MSRFENGMLGDLALGLAAYLPASAIFALHRTNRACRATCERWRSHRILSRRVTDALVTRAGFDDMLLDTMVSINSSQANGGDDIGDVLALKDFVLHAIEGGNWHPKSVCIQQTYPATEQRGFVFEGRFLSDFDLDMVDLFGESEIDPHCCLEHIQETYNSNIETYVTTHVVQGRVLNNMEVQGCLSSTFDGRHLIVRDVQAVMAHELSWLCRFSDESLHVWNRRGYSIRG